MTGLDSLTKHHKDFARLRRSFRGGSLKPIALILFLALAGFFMSSSVISREQATQLRALSSEVSGLAPAWGGQLVQTHAAARRWLMDHGTASEVSAFDSTAMLLFRSAVSLGSGSPDSVLIKLYGIGHLGLMRVIFIVIACWRIWAVTILAAGLYAFLKVRPYTGRDLLGETGNGRLFYSGVRAGLDHLDPSGVPDVQVTGLACPKTCTPAALKASPLLGVLERYGVANETNRALASIIVEYKDWAAHVAPAGEEDQLSQYYAGAGLEENATLVLDRLLGLQAGYLDNPQRAAELDLLLDATDTLLLSDGSSGPANSGSSQAPGAMLPMELPQGGGSGIGKDRSSAAYVELLERSCHRVLSPDMRKSISAIEARELATAVLAFEAGKVLAFARAGKAWLRASNFPQLCARAILHSVPAFASEYRLQSRVMIRRALVYALRGSVFGPVRFAVDLSLDARALRQWMELLVASPHQLQAVTEDVQLFGLASEAHDRWQQALLQAIARGDKEVLENTLAATEANLFFLPLRTILTLFKRSVSKETGKVLKDLMTRVSRRQERLQLAAQTGGDEDGVSAVPDYERIIKPFTAEEITELAALHGLSVQRMEEWSYFRQVLYAYGWLARRVGDSTVPEHCLVFPVLSADDDVPGRNEFGLVGAAGGMVALRSTRLIEQWGVQWPNRFIQGRAANIALTKEQYEKLMRNVRQEQEEPIESGTAG